MRSHMNLRSTSGVVSALLAVATCISAAAQETVKNVPEKLIENTDFKTIQLEYVDASSILKLMAPFSGEGYLTADDDLNAILLMAPTGLLERLEAAIKLLDVARNKEEDGQLNVELTVHLIQGWRMGTADAIQGSEVPTALEDVVTELREVFMYNQYRVIDTLFLRCRDGSAAETSGVLPNAASDSEGTIYQFEVDRVSVTGGDPVGVRLDEIVFSATIPILSPPAASRPVRPILQHSVGIKADIDVRVGQQVVVGKASVSGDESALFVVVSAKVVGG